MQQLPIAALAGVDIMLVDLILRGLVPPGASVLDAGCGAGRNLRPFLLAGHPVAACDRDPGAVGACRALVAELRPELDPDQTVIISAVEDRPSAAVHDLVLCNAVLHFARDGAHARAMVDALWRRVAPGGLLLARLASTIAWPDPPAVAADGRVLDGGGGFSWLADRALLEAWTAELGADLVDPIKSVDVGGRRCMSTWLLRKPV